MRRGGGGRRGITGALIADGLAAHGHDVVVLEQRDFPVDWLDRALPKREFGLTAAGAILSPVAAGVDPLRLASRLLRRMQRQGVRVFDRRPVKTITATTRPVQLTTASGQSIPARHAVIANGYEAQCWLRQRVARNRSSYACISDPIDRSRLGGLVNTLRWESARPACAGAGPFAETSDGLPALGRHAQYGSRVLFALAYGGSGITCNMLGAGLLRAQV